jgi:hypothetical protein
MCYVLCAMCYVPAVAVVGGGWKLQRAVIPEVSKPHCAQRYYVVGSSIDIGYFSSRKLTK